MSPKGAVASTALILFTMTAAAGELRFGLVVHDINGVTAGNDGKESGTAVNVEYLWEPLEGPRWWLGPRPYLGTNLHLEGKTSFAGGGLLWRVGLGERWRLDLGLGLAVHDGETEIPKTHPNLLPEENQRRIDKNLHHIQFGNRLLVRENLALGYRLNERWSAEVFYEHFSHGSLLSDSSNEGLDNGGVRLTRRLSPRPLK